MSIDNSADYPIFILGTGRCGSTQLQRAISLQTRHWIWGEHDGFLRHLFGAVGEFQASVALQTSIFYTVRSDSQLVKEMTLGTTNVSWLNRFQPDALDSAVRDMIYRVFYQSIPHGWRSWGFKEILYGLNNEVPDRLLAMFPTARILVTFREPSATVASMVATWSPAQSDPSLFDENLRIFGDRWRTIMRYFIDLQSRALGNVFFVPMSRSNNLRELFDLLKLEVRMDRTDTQELPSNGVESTLYLPEFREQVRDSLAAIYGDELTDLYSEALSLSPMNPIRSVPDVA